MNDRQAAAYRLGFADEVALANVVCGPAQEPDGSFVQHDHESGRACRDDGSFFVKGRSAVWIAHELSIPPDLEQRLR